MTVLALAMQATLDYFAAMNKLQQSMIVELAQVTAERDKAVRSLKQAGFQDLGGELWRPPVGKKPDVTRIPQGFVDYPVARADQPVHWSAQPWPDTSAAPADHQRGGL